MEDQAEELGGAEELWDACKVAFHAIPDDFINKLYDSAKPDGNCLAGQRNPCKILIT